jgi:putative oligomerization/nucleic acid binding protein
MPSEALWPEDLIRQLNVVRASDEKIVHAVTCRHGVNESGWLVATDRRIWWLGRRRGVGAFLLKEDASELSYRWSITVSAAHPVLNAIVAIRGGAFSMIDKAATLAIGNQYFQMTTPEAERFARIIRDVQVSIADAESTQRATAAVASGALGDNSAKPIFSSADELAKFADLRDRQVITQEEFETKKADILKRQW